jgi:nucleoside-diphosphate-sugar epimerase
MKVALVGPNSSISLAIIPLFKKEDEIITLGRKNADIELDLQSIDVPIKLPENTEVIIHSAAHFGGSSLEDTCDAIKVNILGTLRLFDAAVLSNVRQFVYVSSLYSHLTYNSNLYSIYSLSKRCSEDILKLYSKGKKVKLLIIRPSQIYGNFYSMRKHQPFFYSIIDKIRKNEKVVFWGRRDPSRNFIHIDDLANIIYKSISNGIEGEFDCAFPSNISFIEIAEAAKAAFNSSSEIYFDTSFPDIEDINIEFETSLYPKINFYPRITIKEGMKMLSDFMKTTPNE